jgi:DeoR/GlpR family transcriptional regulator of sugar metabolism
MLTVERYDYILAELKKRGSIKVSQLCDSLNVSTETIRRDLIYLEKQNKLLRIHGGAKINSSMEFEIPYQKREITNTTLKLEIAQKALKFINKNDQIALDTSSTSWFLAQAIPNMPLTVITNSINVCIALSKKDNISVICSGGNLLSSSLSFVGNLSRQLFESYHINKFFLSTSGIHPTMGLSETNEQAVLVKKSLINISEQVYALMDSTKFGVRSLIQLCSIKDIDYLITDSKASKESLGSFSISKNNII